MMVENMALQIPSLQNITDVLQSYNLLERLKKIEQWRDAEAIPAIQSTLNQLQVQQSQIQDAVATLQAQQQSIQQALDDSGAAIAQALDASKIANAIAVVAQDAAQQANTAIAKIRSGFEMLKTKLTAVTVSLNSVVGNVIQWGNVIGYRAAHVLDIGTGPGHLFCCVNDLKWALTPHGPSDGDPNLATPRYSIPEWFDNLRYYFQDLLGGIYSFITSF